MIERVTRRGDAVARHGVGRRVERYRGAGRERLLPVAEVPERVVSRWVDAFNARDLESMLMRLDSRVDFRPLRLGGLGGSYRGHDGVRDWFLQTTRQVGEYQIGLSDVRCVGEGEVFAVGSLHLSGERHIGALAAFHRVDRELIVAAYHCLTDPEMIEYLGLIP